MRSSSLLSAVLLCAAAVSATTPTTPWTKTKRETRFVTTSGTQFMSDGKPFRFVGTNAYWLSALNSDSDIKETLQDIASTGLKVVRTWAFNDVDEIPTNGTWFQSVQDGQLIVNTGTNGLRRLDTIVSLAEEVGLKVILSLTNNWNPMPGLDNTTVVPAYPTRRENTVGTNSSLPRNFLSNSYGGMDFYVRQLANSRNHDEFYLNQQILNAFKNYTTQVVSRYINSPAIFGWELANDPRCNSSLPASPDCTSTTITTWHDDLSRHVRSIDPNHLVSSGAGGFICMGCPKLFPRTQPPRPQSSPAPGRKKRNWDAPFTKEGLLRRRTELWKSSRTTLKRSLDGFKKSGVSGVMIRGRWVASLNARQSDKSLGTAFDGTFGVDSEDILNIPSIGFSSFQLFPDQNLYSAANPNLSPVVNAIQAGTEWIKTQAQLAEIVGKPSVMTAFGLVSQANAAAFVPFSAASSSSAQQPLGASTSESDSAYTTWLTAAANNGVDGALQYQWGQGNLTPVPGTAISANSDGSGTTPNSDTTGASPNDGYSFSHTGKDNVAQILTNATSLFG